VKRERCYLVPVCLYLNKLCIFINECVAPFIFLLCLLHCKAVTVLVNFVVQLLDH